MSVHGPIIRKAFAHPMRKVLVDDRREYRYLDLIVAAWHVASEIERRSKSQQVGVLVPTSGAFPIVALATWMLGRTVVPLNFLLKKDELQYVIDDSECDTIFTVGPMLEYLGYEPKIDSLVKLEDLNFKKPPRPRLSKKAADDDIAVLLYTSGTSGRPKGVMLTHGNIAANIRQSMQGLGVDKDCVMLGVLPQFHSYGVTQLTLTPLTMGARAVYLARFNPRQIIKLLREHRPNVFVGIPSMYNALAGVKDATPDDFSSLSFAISGGEPLPDAVFERFKERFNIEINEGYGMTEMSPATHCCLPGRSKRHSVGLPLPGIEHRIVDPETGKKLSANETGEIRMKGPNLMKGYFKMPEESAAALDEQGYLRTGDMGHIDEDGYLFITGRIKEMLIIGGENVFPREIEEVLNKHETVNASGVVGRQDDVRGEVPVAFIELAEDAEFQPEKLREWCREHLAGYKVPREIHKLDELPRNPTGKILRKELMKMVDRPDPSDRPGGLRTGTEAGEEDAEEATAQGEEASG